MTSKLFILMSISFVIFFLGCLPISGPGVNSEYSDSEEYAKTTLDIASTDPDLLIQKSQKMVVNFLNELGADNNFPKKRVYQKMISSIYIREKVIDWDDAVLLYYDDIGTWMNIIVLKEKNGQTSLWLRKPTCYGWQPPPESPYHKDWLSIIRDECLRRGIQYQ